MSLLTAGQKLPDFVCSTPFAGDIRMSEAVKNVSGKTAILFLRYYGCTLCQLDILEYSEEYEKIAAKNAQLFIVLQSDPKKLEAQLKEGDLPFKILCDPNQEVYKLLDIRPAESMETMIDASSAAKFERLKARNLSHGDYEGNELQLPAVFVVDRDMNLTHAHYPTVATDIPTPEDMAALL